MKSTHARARRPLVIALGLALVCPAIGMAQDTGQITAEDRARMQQLLQDLQSLKQDYAQEVRRLRELDMQIQALQSRVAGVAPPIASRDAPQMAAQPVAPASSSSSQSSNPPPVPTGAAAAPASRGDEGYASTAEDAQRAQDTDSRSVADVKQQSTALFNRRLTLENGISYNRYDRKQVTLNGFLALDAIFLGNIAIENVESDTVNYNFAARWGVSPRLSLNLDVPYIARKTVYQKGGAGGAAAAIAQEETDGNGLGDISASANFKLFGERGAWPETVVNVGVTAPTGREPYGIPWRVLERDEDNFIRFAVPEQQPTGNGLWQATLGLSAVKTTDPAILFGNIGVVRSFARDFDDLDNNPQTVNPGSVQLGNAYYFGAGVAFAFNERTSLSISFSDRLNARARTRYEGGEWLKLIGSDANAATMSLGVTHAMTPNATFVGVLGIGLTPDAPDFNLTVKVPYSL